MQDFVCVCVCVGGGCGRGVGGCMCVCAKSESQYTFGQRNDHHSHLLEQLAALIFYSVKLGKM